MAREWTEKHIRELIRKSPNFKAGENDGKSEINKQLGSVTGLELEYRVHYPVFNTGNVYQFEIAIPYESVLLLPTYSEIFAGQQSFETPIELRMSLSSPYAPVPEDGRLCDLLAPPTTRYRVQGGWLSSNTIIPDDNLWYPWVGVSPEMFDGMELAGGTLRITKYDHTIWLTGNRSMAAQCYGVYIDGLTQWPLQLRLDTTVTIGG